MEPRHDEPVVVGIDRSADSSRALAYAVCEAEREHCSLWLITAVHDVVPVGPMLPLLASDPLVDVGHERLAEADALVERLSEGRVRTRLQVALGPAAELLATAGRQARLVVLGHRDGTRAQRLFTGSTTFGVVARATCPVVSVPEVWDQGREHGRLVAGVDGSAGSAAVLARAFALAAQRGARLEILHCWRLDPFYSYLVDEWSVQQEWGTQSHRIIDGLVARAAAGYPGVRYETRMEYADVADTLVRRAAEADVLVIGRHGRGGLGTRMVSSVLGTVTRTVLQHAPCPVEVVPVPARVEAAPETADETTEATADVTTDVTADETVDESTEDTRPSPPPGALPEEAPS
ncbi:universal stress protein [Isoptericola sp. BMS4]|uniref:universal stress protein n=1 Tax=Isoptericola sp. BMS4 TaxID=2527875 RepID=UPI00141E0E97|nr:universal stress protein [Isoptericola sp. BMS4]